MIFFQHIITFIEAEFNFISASARSKGALLVSANAPIKKIINTGYIGIINQIAF